MRLVTTVIKEGVKDKRERSAIFGLLLIEGYSEAEARKALKDAGLWRSKSSFRATLYEALVAGIVTDKTFEALIKDESENVLKSRSHYDEIRTLVNTVRVTVYETTAAEFAPEDIDDDVTEEEIEEALKAEAEAEAKTD